MFSPQAAFSSVSVPDLEQAKKFYTDTLGLKLTDETMGLNFELPGGGQFFIYPKPDHQPASFTVLNFVVEDINAAADALIEKGVSFEHYDNLPGKPDERGLLTDDGSAPEGSPKGIGWFKDPAGNTIAVIQDK